MNGHTDPSNNAGKSFATKILGHSPSAFWRGAGDLPDPTWDPPLWDPAWIYRTRTLSESHSGIPHPSQ
jgi:hypothetical protein